MNYEQREALEKDLQAKRAEYSEATRKYNEAIYDGDSKASDHFSEKRDEAAKAIMNIKNLIR
jgi:hypothetical protein